MEALMLCLKNTGKNLLTFFKWILFALLVGSIVGLVGALFHHTIEFATHFRETHLWLILLLPLGGLLIVLFYRLSGLKGELGTDLVLLSIRQSAPISLKMAPLIFVSTVITHLFGGSSGREGAALQLGGCIGYKMGTFFQLDEKDLHIITMCGMSAAFSALFGTPLAAAIFSMEVISVGVMYYAALVPCTLAAIIGFSISSAFSIAPTQFTLMALPSLTPVSSLQVIILAMVCAALSILFCKFLHQTAHLYKRYLPNAYKRIALGGIFVLILTLLFRTTDYLGAGMSIIGRAINGEIVSYAFLLKLLFTAITLGAGFKGGEIVPAFFVGATFGHTFGELIGLPSSFSAGLGMIALFCGVTNCPLTAFVLSIELFGSEGALFFLLAVAISYMLSGYSSLYRKQKIMYSKFKPEFIDTLSH